MVLKIMADDYTDIHALINALLDAKKNGSVWVGSRFPEVRQACEEVWREVVSKAQKEGRVMGLNPNHLPW
jgi:hypothetical protein